MEELAPGAPIPDIDDIAAPLAPDGNAWLAYAIVAAALFGVLVLVFVLARRRRPAAGQDYDPQRSAMDQLHRLKEEYLRIPANACALRVSHALREYLFAFHDPGAPYETSGELLRSLAESKRALPGTSLEQLRDLLESCDLLQYARAGDADSRRLGVIEAAIAFLREDSARRAALPPESPKPETRHADSPAA